MIMKFIEIDEICEINSNYKYEEIIINVFGIIKSIKLLREVC